MEFLRGIGIFLICCLLALPIAFLLLVVVAWLFPMRDEVCPRCRQRKLHLYWTVRSKPPTPQFYLCGHCGAHLKRWFTGPWEDTEGPEHDEAASHFWLACPTPLEPPPT